MSPWRYLLFRFGPVYVVATLVGDLAEQGSSAIIWTASIHCLSTSGLAIAVAPSRGQLSRQRIAADLLVIAGILTTSALALLTLPVWEDVLPDPEQYVESLLTAIFAAIVFFAVGRLTARSQVRRDGINYMLMATPRDIDAVVVGASKYVVDRDLALAILIAETLQRPAWFRRLERFAGKLGIARTFGPLQGSGRPDARDADAIDEALRRLGPLTLSRPGGYGPKQAHLQWALERHNASTAFVELAEAVFGSIGQNVLGNSEETGQDGSPGLRLLSRRRVQDKWVLFGDRSGELQILTGVVTRSGGPDWNYDDVRLGEGRYRPTWTMTLSIDDDQVTLGGRRRGEDEGRAQLQIYL